MSTALLVLACVVAIVNVPTSAGLFAWGLAGGDGELEHWYYGVLAVALVIGALLGVGYSFGAFEGISLVRWWLMWLAPAAALLAIPAIAVTERELSRDALTALWAPAALAVPPTLVWVAGGVQG
jgi:hypothetical protein